MKCSVTPVGQNCLEITAILIEIGRRCNCRRVQCYRTMGENEWSKLFAVAVKSVESKSFPSAVVNLPLTYSLIFKSICVSCLAGIKNSRSLWSTDAIGLYIFRSSPALTSVQVFVQICQL